jgi:sporulation protein YlmC with PRC-barrel domain
MAALRQILNKPLISLTDGKKIGEIKDLYFDEKLERIVAISLGSEGLINKKYFALDRANVAVLGIDAWLVKSSDVAVPAESLPEADRLILLSDVRGREIVTEGGTKIGAVDDVLIDTIGTVVGFALTRMVVQGPLAERKTIARSVISTIGSKTSAMTTDLGKAELTPIPTLE